MAAHNLHDILGQLDQETPRMGAIKKLAASIKTDQPLADGLWDTGRFVPRMLAVLVTDKSTLDQDVIDRLAEDMNTHTDAERDHLSDWFMAHQLVKSKRTKTLIEGWQNHTIPVLRRIFWYHQARLRWTGQVPPDNTDALLRDIDATILAEDPQVQWAMNFVACQIGLFDLDKRGQCIEMGERIGLYRDQKVPANCTPNYLPEYIRIQASKQT